MNFINPLRKLSRLSLEENYYAYRRFHHTSTIIEILQSGDIREMILGSVSPGSNVSAVLVCTVGCLLE